MTLVTQLTDVTTRIATEFKSLRVLINGNVIDLSALTTVTKTNLVAAINDTNAQIAALLASSGAISDGTTTTTSTWSSTKTNAAINAAVAALVAAAPAILDTLNELAAALGDDPNFATTMTTALAGKQPIDADLTAIAALVSAADKIPYATALNTWAMATFTAFARTLTAAVDAPAARTVLGLGTAATTAATAYDAAGAATAAQAFAVQRANHTGTQLAATISDFTAAADARVVAGITAKQPLDTDLTAIAALVSAADRVPYATGAGTWALSTYTAFARSLDVAVDAAAARTTLGLGTAATTAATAYDAAGAAATAQAFAIQRANHTGTQLGSTISDLGSTTTDFVAVFNAGLL